VAPAGLDGTPVALGDQQLDANELTPMGLQAPPCGLTAREVLFVRMRASGELTPVR
jgi:hypothetical protein